MKILITGANGQLGTDLVRVCEAAGDEPLAFGRDVLDLADRDSVMLTAAAANPDVIVNCGAWTAVDACESDPDRAYAVNAMGVRWVADAARRTGAHLVHISTDYVFDGTKPTPYDEWDTPNPQSVYGRSKWAGEQHLDPSHACVRTSWVCSAHGNNMVSTVLRLADRPELAFVDDQHGCPTFTTDLAEAVRHLAVERLSGTWHITNSGATTWYGFVRDVLEAVGENPDKVRPITTAELDPPRPAHRPANSVLDNAALRAAGFPPLQHYRDALNLCLMELDALG